MSQPASRFLQSLSPDLLTTGDPVERRLICEYGAIFTAKGVAIPDRIVFRDEKEVADFQRRMDRAEFSLGGLELALQRPAAEALLAAAEKAQAAGRLITPRGADSAARNYADTVELWKSRVEPALDHWMAKGRISAEDAASIRRLAPYEQVASVFKLEEQGIYFAKDLSKSIIYSVAPPGASQHLSLLAFDISEFNDAEVRLILAEHGWYQTVVSDLPHFTFLGIERESLPDAGLIRKEHSGFEFWVPDV